MKAWWQRIWRAFWGPPTKWEREQSLKRAARKAARLEQKQAAADRDQLAHEEETHRLHEAELEAEARVLEEVARMRLGLAPLSVEAAPEAPVPRRGLRCPQCGNQRFRTIHRGDSGCQILGCLLFFFIGLPLLGLGGSAIFFGLLTQSGGISTGGILFGAAVILVCAAVFSNGRKFRKCRACGFVFPI